MKNKIIFFMAYFLAMNVVSSAQRPEAWLTTGNKGINPDSNFIGTIGAKQLVFRVYNKKSGVIDYLSSKANTSFGFQSLSSNLSGYLNSGFGYGALKSNTTGEYNTAAGAFSLSLNTYGFKNTAFGWNALTATTTGNQNTAVGASALAANSTALANTAVGAQSMWYHITGDNNTAIGINSMFNDQTGSYNSAIGGEALFSNISGSRNTAVGEKASYSNKTGLENSAVGYSALYYSQGNANTAMGSYSLYSNTTGYENSSVGFVSLYNNTTGFYNVAIGGYALNSNNSGYYNTAVGHQSLKSNQGSASFNTAVGAASMQYNNSGQYNTAEGVLSLYTNISGNNNTAIGHNSLHFSYCSYNTAIGDSSFFYNDNGNKNTGLGALSGATSSNFTNATAIGYEAIVDASDKVRIGNTNVTSIGGQVSWTTFSDGRYKKNIKEDVKGLAFINSLKPVTYTVDIRGLDNYFHKNGKLDDYYEMMKSEIPPATDEASKIVYNGFIAQDVEVAAEKLNYNFSGVDKPKTKDGLYGLRYADFVVPLVKAVQELSSENEKLKSKNEEQQTINADLQKQINELKAMLTTTSTSANSQQAITLNGNDIASLQQNVPNPYSNTTVINFSLPKQYKSAQIVITDISGQTIQQANVTGTTSLKIAAGSIASGNYKYSLIVDGKLISTKTMLIAK